MTPDEVASEVAGRSFALNTARTRFAEVLARHVRPEDYGLSDRDLVRTVFARWEKEQAAPLVDPNE